MARVFGKNDFLFDVKVARVWLRAEGRMWNCLLLIVIVKRRPAQLYHWIFVKQALKMPDSIINHAIWTKRPCSIVLRTLIKNTKHPLHPFENVRWGAAFEIARRKSLSFCLAFFFLIQRWNWYQGGGSCDFAEWWKMMPVNTRYHFENDAALSWSWRYTALIRVSRW